MLDQPSANDIYKHLLDVLRSERFLKKKGLGNEVPFFICPYNPALAVEMEQREQQLVTQLQYSGITVLDINLYDLTIELLRKREIWNRVVDKETSMGKVQLKELLQNVLDPEKHLVPTIASLIEQKGEFDVMFLSGVGEIYPYIRSHTVLNNLQSKAKDKPTVMFFPGTYTHSPESGASLRLFGRLKDDKYYRAFNILHYSV